jgi:hypothetical protein
MALHADPRGPDYGGPGEKIELAVKIDQWDGIAREVQVETKRKGACARDKGGGAYHTDVSRSVSFDRGPAGELRVCIQDRVPPNAQLLKSVDGIAFFNSGESRVD